MGQELHSLICFRIPLAYKMDNMVLPSLLCLETLNKGGIFLCQKQRKLF